MIFIKEIIILDKETGEILESDSEGKIVQLNPGDKVVTGKSIEELKSTIELEQNFIKIFTNNIMPTIKNLRDSRGKIDYNSLALLFYLMQFISYKTGLLQHDNGRPLTNEYIINNFDMNRTNIYKSLKTLKDKQIIAIVLREDKKQYYMFNPFIAIKGRRVDKTTVHTFDDTIFAAGIDIEY